MIPKVTRIQIKYLAIIIKVMYKMSNRAIGNVKNFVSIFVNFVLFFMYCIKLNVFANWDFLIAKIN